MSKVVYENRNFLAEISNFKSIFRIHAVFCTDFTGKNIFNEFKNVSNSGFNEIGTNN